MIIVLDIFFPSRDVQQAIDYKDMELRREIEAKAKDRG